MFLVYVREAHPTDGWAFPGNVEVKDPATLEERAGVAKQCREDLKFTFPALVDDMQDTANIAYAAWPERLYVIAKDGTIAYAGGMGPFRFSPKECGEFLRKFLADPANAR